MHPTLFLPTLFYFVTLLTVVPVRLLFLRILCRISSHDLCCFEAVRKRGRNAYSSQAWSQEPPH